MFELTEEQLAQLAREHRAALEALRAFGEAIATVARARLVARAMDSREVLVRVTGVEFVATRWPGEWEIERRWREREREHVAVVATIPGSSAIAAEVVDTLLRLAAEWSER